MTRTGEDTRLLTQILEVLAAIAPETKTLPVDPDLPLREQLELDSMDQLHFAIGLHARFGIDIPETDFARLRRLADLAHYLAERLGRPSAQVASAASAAAGASPSITVSADTPRASSAPAISGPTTEPMRPTATAAPDPVPRTDIG